MPAAECAGSIVGGPLVGSAGGPVEVVGDGLDVGERIFLEMFAALAEVSRALNHVIEVRDDAGGHEHLAVVVPVDAPLIAAALGENLEGLLCGVQAPYAAVERRA